MTTRWMSTMWVITRANGSRIPISPMNLRSVMYEIRRVSAGSVVVVLTAGASFHQPLPRRAAGIPRGVRAIARLASDRPPSKKEALLDAIDTAGRRGLPDTAWAGSTRSESGAVRRDALARLAF